MRLFLVALVAALVAVPAEAKTIKVQMRNFADGRPMVFSPAFVQAVPGDTIVFVATDKGHDAASIPGILPPGATALAGKMGQDATLVVSKPGLYGVKCTPHFVMGMVALIKVGTAASNDSAARAAISTTPGLAKKNLTALLDRAKG